MRKADRLRPSVLTELDAQRYSRILRSLRDREYLSLSRTAWWGFLLSDYGDGDSFNIPLSELDAKHHKKLLKEQIPGLESIQEVYVKGFWFKRKEQEYYLPVFATCYLRTALRMKFVNISGETTSVETWSDTKYVSYTVIGETALII